MANSFIVYPNETGSTRDYSVPFEYLSTEFVKATVDGAPAPFTFLSTYMIRFDTAPVGILKIYRETKRGDLINTYINGSILVDDQLNTSFWQSLHISEEVFDSSLKLNENGFWDADNLRITKIAEPSAGSDAVNKQYLDVRFAADKVEVDQNRQLAQAAANAAAASENAARDSEVASKASEVAAKSSENAAALSAANAAASESAAFSSMTAAAVSETNASASESAAAGSAAAASASEDAAAVSASNALASENAAAASQSSASASESAASGSAAAAALSADAAAISEVNAAASASSASESEGKAEKWAEEDEDVEVEPGLYSAKHWAAKAQSFAQGDAVNISFTPTGNLSSSNVQDALEELDSEKATAEQGAKADTAVQPGDLGSAASKNVSDFLAANGKAVDSDKLDGMQPSTDPDANTIVQRNGNGYVHAAIFHQTFGSTNGNIHRIMTQNSGDGYIRPSTPAQIASALVPHLAYTGGTQNNTNFPVGQVLLLHDSGGKRNAVVTVRLWGDSRYSTNGGGSVLSGTWRARGEYPGGGAWSILAQRVA